MYDLLAGHQGLGPSGYSTLRRTLDECPLLQAKGLKGGIRYYDGQFNDCRMAVSLALTAAAQGALVANHLAVLELHKQAGQIDGVLLEDRISGEQFCLQAETVINATGPFADRIRQLDQPDAKPLVAHSSGVHIVLDQHYPPPKAGLLLTETEDQRVLFLLPWQGRCLVGTTDSAACLEEHPKVTEAEIDYLLRHLQPVLDPPPTRQNVTASWSGLRPLVRDPEATDTAHMLRDCVIEESPSGLFSIVGGKWTSYRRMAEKLLDQLVAKKGLQVAKCQTRDLPVRGASGWHPLGWQQLVSNYALLETTARHLHATYGSCASQVAEIAVHGFDARLAGEFPAIEAEVIYACRYELAERPIDVLARRLPLALLDTGLSKQVSARVLALMAAEFEWNATRIRQEKDLLSERLEGPL